MYKRIVRYLFFVSLAFVTQVSMGQAQTGLGKQEKLLGEWDLETASEDRVAEVQGLLEELQLQYEMLDRYALYCAGRLYKKNSVERFEFLHAEDRDNDAERHVFVRKFLDEDDPLLDVGFLGDRGFDSSINGVGSYHNIHGDRLRLGQKNYVSSDPADAIESRNLNITAFDRHVSPLACTMLPYANFFATKAARGVPGISGFKTDRAAKIGGLLVARFPWKFPGNAELKHFSYVAFRDGVPVAFEFWRHFRESKKMMGRSQTTWRKFGNYRVPIGITVDTYNKPERSIELHFEWRFNDKVSDRLFEISDVTFRRDLDW